MKFYLARLAELVLEEFDPDEVWCHSYDKGSWEPTLDALDQFKKDGSLPQISVPGSYAPIVYEEAALMRYARVNDHKSRTKKQDKRSTLDPRDLPAARALAFIEVEAFLQGLWSPYDEARNIVPGLLALPGIMEPEWRRALAHDMNDLLGSPPGEAEPRDFWCFALATPALLQAADLHEDQVMKAQSVVDAMTVSIVERQLFKHFESSSNVMDVLRCDESISMEIAAGWIEEEADLKFAIAQGELFGHLAEILQRTKPIYADSYDEMFRFISEWCPESAQRLRSPLFLEWTEPQAKLEVRPHEKNPLWSHSVRLVEGS